MAREVFLTEHPAFRMVGTDFICPNSTIKKLCEEAKYIVSTDDFPVELRSDLKYIFFSLHHRCHHHHHNNVFPSVTVSYIEMYCKLQHVCNKEQLLKVHN